VREIILIAHNVRSTYNVGSLLRTADGLGVKEVFLTGYTPYPQAPNDERLPYIAKKVDAQIHKTALGAEKQIAWRHSNALMPVLDELRRMDFTIVALEQHPRAVSLSDFTSNRRLALIVGREVEGIEAEVLAASDLIVEIPMRGHKESFNVASAAAMALYVLTA